MCSFDGVVVCSNLPCWNLLHSAGVSKHKCGVCAAHEENDDRLRKHAAQFALLASVRSTSRFLVLFRSGTVLRQRLADISAGTLPAAAQEYLVRLNRRNLRLLLTGKNYDFRPVFLRLYLVRLKRRNLRLLLTGKIDGFRPVFLRLGRKWLFPFDTNQDCLEYLLDFVAPSDELRG